MLKKKKSNIYNAKPILDLALVESSNNYSIFFMDYNSTIIFTLLFI